ncbi:MAG: AbrB family transcriptional regulator [Betaproteobacteria bacterium]
MRPARDTFLNPLASLALCVAGAVLFVLLKTPLPWMIGPLVVMAAMNFSGARLRAPRVARPAGQVIVGTALGLYFTPEVARQVLTYWHLLLLAALLAILIACACAWFLNTVTDTDRTTAFFASVPGGAAEMSVLAERFGARTDRVAIAQSMRILAVVVVIPFALTYSGVHGADVYAPATAELDWGRLGLLLAIAATGAGLLALLGAPNAFMLGALFSVIGLTVAEVSFSAMPPLVSNAGQLLIGCALGGRFERSFLDRVPRFVAATLGSILIAMALAAALGTALAWAYGLPVPSVVLATAPGGIAEMCITAKVLQLGVPLVTAAHVTRVIVLVTGTGMLFRVARRLAERFRKA